MFYDIVFFLSPESVAAGAKVSLVAGQYVITKAPTTTIQAVNGGRPPLDQTSEIDALKAQVAQLTIDLAACRAGNTMPTISGMTALPAAQPVGGGPVVVDAVVTGATSTKLDGVEVVLPVTVNVTADHTFVLVASNAAGSVQATASVTVAVVVPPPKPTITGMAAVPNQLPVGGGPTTIGATVTGATSTKLSIDGVDQGEVVLPVTVNLT